MSTVQEIKELKQLYLNVFDSADGKKVLEDLSKKLYVYRTPFDENSNNMSFKVGQQSVILHIKNMMNIDIKKTEELINKIKTENEGDPRND